MTTRTTAAARAAALGLLAPSRSASALDLWKETGLPTVGQRTARARAQVRPARPADPDGARARLASFVPEDPLARPHAALVRSLASAARPADAADAGELLSALSGHAAWLSATGAEVTADSVVDPDLVQRWVLHGLAGLAAGTAANYRSRLGRVAAAVTGGARPAPLHASDPCKPYSPAEEDRLVVWAGRLRTERMRADVTAVVVLGLGAGLSAAETVETDGGDIRKSDGTVLVTVHDPRARTVPVRAGYAPAVLALADQAGSRPLFRPGAPGRVGKNAIGNLVAKARVGAGPGLPRVTPQRLRATWLVRHLAAGTRPDALLRAAGLDDLGSLDRYLRWLPPSSDLDAAAVLARSGA